MVGVNGGMVVGVCFISLPSLQHNLICQNQAPWCLIFKSFPYMLQKFERFVEFDYYGNDSVGVSLTF